MKNNHLHFQTDELALVLSRFDLGRLSAVAVYDRGCRRSPKVTIVSEKGAYLLKRRASGKDDTQRISISHEIQAALQREEFPVAKLVANKVDGKTFLRLGGHAYELFDFVRGKRCHSTSGQIIQAGATLARYHQILASATLSATPPTGGVHHSAQIQKLFRKLVAADLGAGNAPLTQRLQGAMARLGTAYHGSATRVNQLGYTQWPPVITHCDWHPGNLLFDSGKVVAVLDHDSPRVQPRVADVASAIMQFSIKKPLDASAACDPSLDMNIARNFLIGYDTLSVISVAEIKTIPWLMIEAIAARVAVGLASRIFHGAKTAGSLIYMMDARVGWIADNAQEIVHELLKPLQPALGPMAANGNPQWPQESPRQRSHIIAASKM